MPERQHSILCPSCNGNKSTVVDGGYLPREYKGLPIRRRIRECRGCGDRFATIELTEDLFSKLRWPGSLQRNKIRSAS